MAITIGSLLVNLGLESGAFKSGLSNSEKDLKNATRRMVAVGKDMQETGQRMTLGITLPFLALGKVSIDAAMESRDALAMVEASLASMGNGAGRTVEQLKALANTQMGKSLYDDDEILRKVTANLLTFGNIAGQEFDRAQQAVIDLSATLGKDLQDAALQVGKSLNDPIKGLAALGEAGIQFTDQQRAQVKAMAEVGDMAGAQRIMLAELEKQFGNHAAAARGANPFAALKQSFEELKETAGEVLLPQLEKLMGVADRMLKSFNNMSPGTQATIIAIAGLAAAAGPLLSVLGMVTTVTAPFTAAIGLIGAQGGVVLAAKAALAGLSAVLAPIAVPLAAVAAAGALIYANWDKIGPVLSEFWKQAKAALGPEFENMIATISATLSELWNGPLGQAVKTVISNMVDLGLGIAKVVGPVVIAALKSFMQIANTVFAAIGASVKILSELFRGNFSEALKGAWMLFDQIFGGIPTTVVRVVLQVKDWIVNKLGAIWDTLKAKLAEIRKAFTDLLGLGNAGVRQNASIMVQAISYEMNGLRGAMVDPAQAAANDTVAVFKTMADDTLAALDQMAGAIRGGGFLDILSSVIGLGLQLGSIGLFGGKVADRINLPRLPAPSAPSSPGINTLLGSAGTQVASLQRGVGGSAAGGVQPVNITVTPSKLFDVHVNNQIAQAAPAIASAGGEIGVRRMTGAQARRLA